MIVDSDGVGGGVADQIKGTNFVNNSKALHEQNFSNLKSQCYVKLSELFKEGKMLRYDYHNAQILSRKYQEDTGSRS